MTSQKATMKPSHAQAKLLSRITNGARLSFDHATGRYVLTQNGSSLSIDQRPVLTMIRNGLLHQDMTGYCRPAV